MYQTIAGLAAVGLDALVEGQENDRGGDDARATRVRYGEVAARPVRRRSLKGDDAWTMAGENSACIRERFAIGVLLKQFEHSMVCNSERGYRSTPLVKAPPTPECLRRRGPSNKCG